MQPKRGKRGKGKTKRQKDKKTKRPQDKKIRDKNIFTRVIKGIWETISDLTFLTFLEAFLMGGHILPPCLVVIALPVITKFAVEVYAKVLALLVLLEKDGAPGVVVALHIHTSNTNSSPTQKYKRLK